jgi:hypothetical protein
LQLGGWTWLDGPGERGPTTITPREPTAAPLPGGAQRGTARLSELRGRRGGGRLARRTAWVPLAGGPKREPGGGTPGKLRANAGWFGWLGEGRVVGGVLV